MMSQIHELIAESEGEYSMSSWRQSGRMLLGIRPTVTYSSFTFCLVNTDSQTEEMIKRFKYFELSTAHFIHFFINLRLYITACFDVMMS